MATESFSKIITYLDRYSPVGGGRGLSIGLTINTVGQYSVTRGIRQFRRSQSGIVYWVGVVIKY